MKMLPSVLKELVKHVPTVLFKVIDWNELISEFHKLSRRIIQKEGHEKLFGQQKHLLVPFGVALTQEPLKKTSHQVTKSSGITLLEIYFAQLYSSEGLFIDLRSQHFHSKESSLYWHPTGLWTKFAENFRQGLLKVYEGFYLENEEIYHEGLKGIGLIKEEWSKEDKQRLSSLFKAQFGSALTSDINFELDSLRNAILEMSEFMLQKEIKISKDFLYLGIYLVTLYAHLEEGGEKYPVKQIYLRIKDHFQSH